MIHLIHRAVSSIVMKTEKLLVYLLIQQCIQFPELFLQRLQNRLEEALKNVQNFFLLMDLQVSWMQVLPLLTLNFIRN